MLGEIILKRTIGVKGRNLDKIINNNNFNQEINNKHNFN